MWSALQRLLLLWTVFALAIPVAVVTASDTASPTHIRSGFTRSLRSPQRLDDLHQTTLKIYPGGEPHELVSSTGANPARVLCLPYDETRHRRRPKALQKWWDQQKKRDAKEAEQGQYARQEWFKSVPKPFWPKQGPRFIVYTCCVDNADVAAKLPAAQDLAGINVLVLAFLVLEGPSAKVQGFFSMSLADRRKYIRSLHDHGIALMLSVFGGDETQQPTTQGYDPVLLGELHGDIARESGFDGLDNDWEDFPASDDNPSGDRTATEWLVRYTEAVRSRLPTGSYALTAAPIAGWFSSNTTAYCSGMFRAINQRVGSLYDWYNIQFYNQGVGRYDSCHTLLFKSNTTTDSRTSIFQIHRQTNISLDKLVIGKPGIPEDAGNGYMTPQHLSRCTALAKNKGWNAGVMSWQYPDADSRWFQTVRGEAFKAAQPQITLPPSTFWPGPVRPPSKSHADVDSS